MSLLTSPTPTEAGARPPDGISAPRLLVLALLASVGSFGSDLYLSGFPRIAADLHAGDSAVQLSLTMFLLGLAVGQLGIGPLSDRIGRRRPLLIGLGAFVAASVVVALAPTIPVLLGARLVQGLSAAAGMVLARAVVADRQTGRAAARAFSLMTVAIGVAPVAAPLIGSLLVGGIGWRGVLGVLAVIAVVMLLGAVLMVPESLPPERRGAGRGAGLRPLGRTAYLAATATFAFSFAVMFAYISASPFLYQQVIGMSPAGYGALFALNAIGLALCSATGARLLRTRDPLALLRLGVPWLLTAALGVLVVALAPVSPAWLLIPIFLTVASLGFVAGPATALALGAVPEATGTGSAVLGASQFGLAAVVIPLVGLGGGAAPMAIVMSALAVLAALAFAVLRATERRTTPPSP